MFANVIPTSVPRTPLAPNTHEPGARLVLKVPSPTDPLRGEQVHYRGYVLWYADVLVVVEAEVVTRHGSNVIGLRGVRLGVVFCQKDALAREVDDVWIVDYFGEVLSVGVVEASAIC